MTTLEAIVRIAQTLLVLHGQTKDADAIPATVEKACLFVEGVLDHQLKRDAVAELRRHYR